MMDCSPQGNESVFQGRDSDLQQRASQVRESRKTHGLDGLTGDLAFIILHTEIENQQAAVEELLRYTGYELEDAFESEDERTCVLKCPDSADVLVRCRLKGDNPFLAINRFPKSAHVPNTRLETLVFTCEDVQRYWEIQRGRGIAFLTKGPLDLGSYSFIQTTASIYTGNSVGFVQWHDKAGGYRNGRCRTLDWKFETGPTPWKKKIGTLDHIATRVKAEHRDPAILEFMNLSSYDFEFAIYVPDLNSITNVARLVRARFAQVFTSGIAINSSGAGTGPTEMFVKNYGARVHHMAFLTDDITAVDAALRQSGLGFLSDLVGSEAEGLRQSFSAPSPNTLLVNEYICRYGDFKGFFTRQNVTQLTLATGKQ
ncbi:MAG TPA: hypothetical protein PKO23_04820 [Candidatus Hydrogenedentes bacterium]|jgi:hypothetical protein|nr:hypothetical protein [Candidatus Hydrogenedentota bacterium]